MFMSEELKQTNIELGNELCSIIQENDNCELQMNEEFSGKFWIHSENYETEFRFNLFINNFIISRVQFQNRKNNCMTKCLGKIMEYTKALSIKTITIQSVMTLEMESWCLKNGLKINETTALCVDENLTCGDYVLGVN